MRALILGETPGALAVVRELGRSGWTVGVGSSETFGLAAASRWCSRHHNLPRPLGDLQPFIEGINSAARTEGYEIVFGGGDAEVLALSANRHMILPLFPYGPDDGVRKGFDKLSLSRLATKFGIHTPRTLPASEASLERLDASIAVKSRLHWTPGIDNRRPRVEASLCRDNASALRQAERMRSLGAEPLFQAYVPGRNMVLTTLVDKHGSVISGMAQVEMYEGPWRPNANFRAVTIAIDKDLLKRCQNLLNEIRWFGLSCFQFQMTNDGTPFLIDFNGRAVWDSALASSCGMKGHDTWARLAIGARLPQRETFFVPEGQHYQDIENDLRHTLISGREPRRILSEIAQFLSHARKSVHPVFARDDVLPVMSYLVRIPRRIFKKTLNLLANRTFLRRARSRTRH